MMKSWKSRSFLVGAALLGGVVLSGTPILAGDVDVAVTATLTSTLSETNTTPLHFGDVEISQGGDTITIDASTNLPITTTSVINGSVVTGSPTSGLITVASPSAFTIQAAYPASVTVSDTVTDCTLQNVEPLSGGGTTNGAVVHAAGVDSLIYVGGDLVIPAGATAGSYTGTLVVTLTYI